MAQGAVYETIHIRVNDFAKSKGFVQDLKSDFIYNLSFNAAISHLMKHRRQATVADETTFYD